MNIILIQNLSLFYFSTFLVIYISIIVCVSVYKCCKDSPLFWMIFMQGASTEWFLGVQLQDFDNQYNAKIINGNYCCCDDNEICSSNLNSLLGSCTYPSTAQTCETYFLVHIRDCSYNSGCFLSKNYQMNCTSSASMFDHDTLSISFMEMELGDKVRTKTIVAYLIIRAKLEWLQSRV